MKALPKNWTPKMRDELLVELRKQAVEMVNEDYFLDTVNLLGLLGKAEVTLEDLACLMLMTSIIYELGGPQ